jgi:glycosyltransferase involved in cell wall biosynthesis
LLEAMAAGIPVIATPVGAIPDVLTEGLHGCLVPVRDGRAIAEALATLHADREKISWMSRACRRRIRAAFSIDRLAQELSLMYSAVCGDTVMAGAGLPPVKTKAGARLPSRPTPEKLKD